MNTKTRASKRATSKYRELAKMLQAEIEMANWPGGHRLPSEQDLAKRFDVAYMTMRQAVTVLVDEGIVRRIHGKGTFVQPRRTQIVSGHTKLPMSFLFPAELRDSDPYYFPEVLRGFQRYMDEQMCRCVLHTVEAIELPDVLEAGSAIACLQFGDDDGRFADRLHDRGHRVLAINRYTGRYDIPSVRIDDALGVQQGIDYLYSLGHQRIGFIAGHPDNVDAQDRLNGFRVAVKEHGLRIAPEAGGDFTEATGYAAAQRLLSMTQRPTAIACASDLSAIGAARAARDLGLSVPRALSLVGFGDFSVAEYMSPSLTTVRQCREDLGRVAAEMLIKLASDEKVEGKVLQPTLVIRESTSVNILDRVNMPQPRM